MTATRSTPGMMHATLNFRAVVPMLGVMNASAQVTAAPIRGPKLDNRRVLAALVDLAIVGAGAALILFAGDSLTGERQGALGAVILGWALYYFFALESGDGQTVGKRLMKLRVVRANGAPAGMREVAVRTVLRVVDNYLVGLIAMLATGERRQRIGDLAAGTDRGRRVSARRGRERARAGGRGGGASARRGAGRGAGRGGCRRRDPDDHPAVAPDTARDPVRPDRAGARRSRSPSWRRSRSWRSPSPRSRWSREPVIEARARRRRDRGAFAEVAPRSRRPDVDRRRRSRSLAARTRRRATSPRRGARGRRPSRSRTSRSRTMAGHGPVGRDRLRDGPHHGGRRGGCLGRPLRVRARPAGLGLAPVTRRAMPTLVGSHGNRHESSIRCASRSSAPGRRASTRPGIC